jgi:hypothetical protein
VLINVACAVPSALISEVEDLVTEARDFIVSQDAFEAQRTHDRFSRYCDEHLRVPGDNTTVRAVLVHACTAEADVWDRREHLRDKEVHVLETALALIQSPAVQLDATALVQVAAVVIENNRTVSEEVRLCHEDLDQVAKLKWHLEKKVNQTAAAVAQVILRVDTGRGNVSAVKRQARSTVDRISSWDQSYAAQEDRLAGEETRKAAASRAVEESAELLGNFYTQSQTGAFSQLALDPEAQDIEALRDEDAWPANLLEVWPDCPDRPAPYVFHHALATKILSVLQALSKVMHADVDGTKHVEESVQAEARRVRGFRGRAAHETREHLARLKADIKESNQALVVLKDRQHTEENQLQAVLDKMAQLKQLCAKVTEQRESAARKTAPHTSASPPFLAAAPAALP